MKIGRIVIPLRLIIVLVIIGISLTILIYRIWFNSDTLQHEKIVVALYSGQGTWDESVQAAEKMFQWMNYTVELVSPDVINSNQFEGFGILCVPGGDMYQYAQDISSQGKENIRNFIRDGGGYIGICGGAYFASETVVWRGNVLPMTPLELFQGTAAGPINEITPDSDFGMCTVNITDSAHPITQIEPQAATTLYYWGPALTPKENAEVTVLGRYAIGNQPAMLAFDYGSGRVFVVGTHPEIEEDSQRDGVIFADQLDDQGSEWDLMRKAALWVLEK